MWRCLTRYNEYPVAMAEEWFARAKRRMREVGVTQEDLKKPLGVKTRGAVGHYLTGRRQPNPRQLGALAKTLQTSVDWLFADQDKSRTEQKGVGALSQDEQVLVKKYRLLSSRERTHLHAISDALATASPTKPHLKKALK